MLSTIVAVTLAQAPVVVELFSSEGCSSCPQAERALAALDSSSGVEVLALERHVENAKATFELDPKYEVANLAVVAVARDSEAGPITAAGRVSVVSARTPTH